MLKRIRTIVCGRTGHHTAIPCADLVMVFMIIGACWSQIQYRAMLLMPWVLMLRGPTPASKGVLLDYDSDWIATALFKSLRKKHFLVSLPI